jgi:hypothetical protein
MSDAQREREPSSRPQEKIVAMRSGNACAYPGCGLPLVVDAQHDEDLAKPVGKFAHIAAASVGGPRYDSAMTSAQRRSADNLILLCATHHDVVDSQLHQHTAEFLLTAKAQHEAAVARGVRHALGEVTFEHLSVVCQVLTVDAPPADAAIDLPLEIAAKIALNDLGPSSADKIRDGLAQARRVQAFLEWRSRDWPAFGQRLVAGFRALYYQAIADGIRGDELFDLLLAAAEADAGPRDTPELRAAALAVVAHLFEMCEVFEHEPAAS